MPFDTPNQGDQVLESDDVDHDQTSNRNHAGDSISPASVSTDSATITGGADMDGSDVDNADKYKFNSNSNLEIHGFGDSIFISVDDGGGSRINSIVCRDGGAVEVQNGDIEVSGALDGDHAELTVQDVTNISSPAEGEVAYHDGSGNAGKGVAYFDGTNWNVLDGGTQP